MPWIPYCKPPEETPAHYKMPFVMTDNTLLGRNIEYAKEQRKSIGQLREEIIGYQKSCGRNDVDGARFFSGEAAELMKQYRGWDAAIKIIEGDNDFWHKHVAEPIAPYVDMAFVIMDLQD